MMTPAVVSVSVLTLDTEQASARIRRTTCWDDITDQPRAGEFLNDSVAYAWSQPWQDLWDASSGYGAARLSAGSLDAREFLYLEEINLSAAPPGSPLWIFLRRQILEQGPDESVDHELSLSLPTVSDSFVPSLLTDTDSNKKWSDLGLAIGKRKSMNDFAEIYFWSPDHYYNTKALDEDSEGGDAGKWQKHPYSWGFRVASPERNARLSHLNLEVDTPARFRSSQLTCEYRALSLHARGKIPVQLKWLDESGTNRLLWRIALSRHDKLIDKFGDEFVDPTKSSRMTTEVELALDRTLGPLDSSSEQLDASLPSRGHWHAAILWHQDRIKIQNETHRSYDRDEVVLSTRYTNTMKEDLWYFLGAIGSLGHRTRPSWTDANEIVGDDIEQLKFQTGIEWRILESAPGAGRGRRMTGAFRTLANWDIDHLVSDFPYKKHSIRPWDGGLLQFIIVH